MGKYMGIYVLYWKSSDIIGVFWLEKVLENKIKMKINNLLIYKWIKMYFFKLFQFLEETVGIKWENLWKSSH